MSLVVMQEQFFFIGKPSFILKRMYSRKKNVLKICKLGKMNIFGSLNNVLLMNDFIKMMKTKVGPTTNQKICGMMNNKNIKYITYNRRKGGEK